jgi:hypothetical protein
MNRYKYLLHGHFDNNVTKIIDTARNYLFKKYTKEKYDMSFTYGFPHISIIYGPVINSDNMIILTDKVIDNFYPGFLDKFKNLPSDIKYIGVSAFFSMDRVIIKASFESKQLNKIKKYLIDSSPKIRSYYDEFKINYNEHKKELKKKYPNIYVKDKSWIHSTLIVLKPDVSEQQITKIINDADNFFKLKKGTVISLKEIGVYIKENFYRIL